MDADTPWKAGEAWRGPVEVQTAQLEVLEVGGRQLPFIEDAQEAD
ncbi:hypothetical protein ACFP81_05330 [Deinococcus lacus]|uniref:Uncharacterized protein n=1 Tax=Deinococcus lacus TaxID=392561 RepID=A0ABW1YBA9_9DEIO